MVHYLKHVLLKNDQVVITHGVDALTRVLVLLVR